MKKISSRQNPEIIECAKLARDKKFRQEKNKFIAEGLRTISTLLTEGLVCKQLYSTHEMGEQALQLLDETYITWVNPAVMKKMSSATTPSGILGIFEIPKKPSLDHISAGIILDHIADPGNMGTLIRTTAAMGKKTVIVLEGADPWSPKVVQSSAGTIGMLHIFELSHADLKKISLPLIGLIVQDGTAIDNIQSSHCLLAVGSEAQGLRPETLHHCTNTVSLAMPGKTESLNAAIAGSIALYLLWSGN